MYELHKAPSGAMLKQMVHLRLLTRLFHNLLFIARVVRSLNEDCGLSWSREPSGTLEPPQTYAASVRLTSRFGLMRARGQHIAAGACG